MNRHFIRLEKYYLGYIDNDDSFNGPKDFVDSYFHATYSLKEALKKIDNLEGSIVESLIDKNNNIALGIDISNKQKHIDLNSNRSGNVIGKINTHIHVLDPQGNDRTELTIEIDGKKKDCLKLAKENLGEWGLFLKKHRLI